MFQNELDETKQQFEQLQKEAKSLSEELVRLFCPHNLKFRFSNAYQRSRSIVAKFRPYCKIQDTR